MLGGTITESWEDDADVVLFCIWSRRGIERGAVGWDHGRGVEGVEGVREVCRAGCHSLGVVGVNGVKGVREVLAVLTCGCGVEGCRGVISVEEVLAALACSWGVVDV